MITGFVFAGAETTRRQLTAAVVAARRAPRRLGAARRRPGPAARTRWRRSSATAGSCPGMTRRAEEPFERDDLARRPRAGGCCSPSRPPTATPTRFEDPTAFVVDRPDAHAHVTFGWGPHLCVGAGLARLELAEGLGTLTHGSARRRSRGRARSPSGPRTGYTCAPGPELSMTEW